MKRPTFMHGVLIAAALSILASVVVGGLLPFVTTGSVFRLLIPMLGFVYLVYLLRECETKTGRLTTVSLWSALAVVAWWFSPPLPVYLLIHAGAIWLVRSLYYYAGFLPAVVDAALSALALAGLVWAAGQTGSVLIATWTFFLVHALSAWIPERLLGSRRSSAPRHENRFKRAEQQAQAAVRQLLNT